MCSCLFRVILLSLGLFHVCADQSPARSSWSNIQARAKNAVVQVFSAVVEFNWALPCRPQSPGEPRGTGFFVDERGYFITNAHVVNQARKITIQVPDLGRERLDAVIVGISYDRDLALLRIDELALKKIKQKLGKIPILPLGNSHQVHRGDEVMVLGYPLGQECLKSTVGVVSGRDTIKIDALSDEQFVLQVDAAINPGNSGGPTVDVYGEVIGINTAGAVGQNIQNIGYIIPVNELKVILDELYCLETTQDKILRKPFLGVELCLASSELNTYLGNPMGGLYVAKVLPQSILYQAGLRDGDVIHAINGLDIDHYGQLSVSWCEDKISLANYLAYLKSPEQVVLVVYRRGEQKELTLSLKQAPLPPVRIMHPEFESVDYELFGGIVMMQLAGNHVREFHKKFPALLRYANQKNMFKACVVIVNILPGSLAQRSRVLYIGGRIAEVNDQPVVTIAQVREAFLKDKFAEFVRIKLADGTLVVYRLADILREESQLAAAYKFSISSTVQTLMREREGLNEQKTPGSLGSAATATT